MTPQTTDVIAEICTTLRVSRVEVEHWVAAGWAHADGSEPDWARIRLLADLREDMGIERETIPVILSLIDQVHGLRARLRLLGEVIAEQPDDVRQQIVQALKDR